MCQAVEVQDVSVASRDPARLAAIVGDGRIECLTTAAGLLDQLRGRVVLNVSSTAAGGGVAEMLHVLLGYVRGVGIDTRWAVIAGNPDFFVVTKRIHNHLYGGAGDGGPLGDGEHRVYQQALAPEAVDLAARARAGDVVVLHDPQVAGLAEQAKRLGCRVVWRCHVGIDEQNAHSLLAWDFLRRYLEEHVDHYVFSHDRFPPPWVPRDRVSIIWPSIDPFAPKNQDLTPATVEAILTHVGLIDGSRGPTTFTRGDGTAAGVQRMADIIRTGPPPPADTPLVVQVSRWTR